MTNAADDIAGSKPGWLSRLFGIESGQLIACDAVRDGERWSRKEQFQFLYRTRAGNFHLLRTLQESRPLVPSDALELFRRSPQQLVAEAEAFGGGEK